MPIVTTGHKRGLKMQDRVPSLFCRAPWHEGRSLSRILQNQIDYAQLLDLGGVHSRRPFSSEYVVSLPDFPGHQCLGFATKPNATSIKLGSHIEFACMLIH